MKKILPYVLSCLMLLGASCAEDDAPVGGEGVVNFRIETTSAATRGEYDPLDDLLIRIYKADGGLIRRYTSLDDMPENLYLVAGGYKITVEAGNWNPATRTEKSYRGEKDFTVLAQQVITERVVCPTVNTGVRVSFDQSVADKFDLSACVYVSASDRFELAAINEVPTLRFDLADPSAATGYFILPEGVSNLSWGFYGEGTNLGEVKQLGVIENAQSATIYKLKFQYSKTPAGSADITVQIETAPEEHNDNFIFNPQPSIKGDGFSMDETIGYNGSDIRFEVSSVKKLATVTLTANDTTYPVYDASTASAALQDGISYVKTDDNNLTVVLGAAFFAEYGTGLHELRFDMTDNDGGTGTGSAKFAMPGLMELTASDYDLWTNTATFRAIVTDPGVTDVVFSYRTPSGEWIRIPGVKGADHTYTATAAPGWTEGTDTAHATYLIDTSTGIFANRDYEYKVSTGSTESPVKSLSTAVSQTIPYGDMEDTGLSCFTTDNASAPVWASGNNSFADELCTPGTFNGMQGAHCARLAADAPVGILAAGNLFTGLFYKDGLTKGVVEFGQPYTWKARPTAMRVKYYAEKIGTIDIDKKYGAPLKEGDQDKARIFVAIVDWNARHKVSSGTSKPTGTWDPMNGPDAVPEGRIIGYGSIFIEGPSAGGTMIEATLPLYFYDKQAKPSGAYSLVISCSTSAYGDFMAGCSSNVMYVDDFEWVY